MSKHADPKTAEATGTAIVTIEDVTIDRAPAIFGHNSLSLFVQAVRAEVIGEVPDLTTDNGRKRIASLAATVARSKTAVDGVGRAYLKQLKGLPKIIEAELREFEADMNAVRDEVRKPLNEWEAEQEKAKAVVQEAMDELTNYYTLPAEGCDSQAIRFRYAQLQSPAPTVEVFGDRLEEAVTKQQYGLGILSKALDERLKFEKDQEELEQLRKDAAARTEQDRIKAAADKAVEDERQRVAQEQQAQRDADAQRIQQAEQQAREADQRTQQAERDRIDAEERAENERRQSDQRAEQARLDEQQRQQAEADEANRLRKEREANRAHCGAINKAALDALLAVNMSADGQVESFLSAAEAKAIITAIIRGQIPAVAITY